MVMNPRSQKDGVRRDRPQRSFLSEFEIGWARRHPGPRRRSDKTLCQRDCRALTALAACRCRHSHVDRLFCFLVGVVLEGGSPWQPVKPRPVHGGKRANLTVLVRTGNIE